MQHNTVIFDMDGLLVNSEIYWEEAARETLNEFDVVMTLEQYHQSTGLRTKEWIDYWFNYFLIDKRFAEQAGRDIVARGMEKIRERAQPMQGVDYILSFFKQKNFKIGLATSSSVELIDVVVDKLNIRSAFDAFSSADRLPHGKPHPEVFMQCAMILESAPLQCVCFEDSFNGMISAKAARMKCVVVPDAAFYENQQWNAADLKLSSLNDFNEDMLAMLDTK